MSKYLCIEVGEHIIKFAEVSKSGKKVQVLKTHIHYTDVSLSFDGRLKFSDEVVEAVQEGLIESKIKTKEVYFITQSSKLLYKIVDLPQPPQTKMVQGMLENKFSDYFPVKQEDYHISYSIIRNYKINNQKMIKVEVYAVNNALSEDYYRLSVALKLNAKGLRHACHSVYTLLAPTIKRRNLQDVAIINIGEDVSSVAIFNDNDMMINKSFSDGIDETIERVQKDKSNLSETSYLDALIRLYTENIIGKTLPEAKAIASDSTTSEKLEFYTTKSLTPIIKSIATTLDDYIKKERHQINEIFISGLGAGVSGISQLIEAQFNIQVSVVQESDNIKLGTKVEMSPLLLSIYPTAGAAIDTSNMFTKAEKAGGEVEKKKQADNLVIIVAVAIAIAASLFGAKKWYDANEKYKEVEKEYKWLESEISRLRAAKVEEDYNTYQLQKSYYEEVTKLYDHTKSGNEDISAFLADLENTLAPSVRVLALSLTPTSANVSLECDDRYVAAATLHLLRHMKTTHSMDCSGVSEDEETGKVSFSISLTLKTNEELKAEAEAEAEYLEAQAEAEAEAEGLEEGSEEGTEETVEESQESETEVVENEEEAAE